MSSAEGVGDGSTAPPPPIRTAQSLKSQAQAGADAARRVFYSAARAHDAASAAEWRSTQDALRLELFARLPDVGISWFVIRGLLMGPLVARRFPVVASRASVLAVVPAVLEFAYFQFRGERRFQTLVPTFTSDTELGAAMREAYASAAPPGSAVFAEAAAKIAQSPLGRGSQLSERSERKNAFANEIALILEKQSTKNATAALPAPPKHRTPRAAELDGNFSSKVETVPPEARSQQNEYDDDDIQAAGFTMDDSSVDDGDDGAGRADVLPSGETSSSWGRHAEKTRVIVDQLVEPVPDVFGDLFPEDVTQRRPPVAVSVQHFTEDSSADGPSYKERQRRRERIREGSRRLE